MFKWISKQIRPTDGGASSEAHIKDFLDTLPTSKPALALHDIGERFAAESEFEQNASVCRRALRTLDEAAQAYTNRVWGGLFGDSLGKSISESSCHDLANYYRSVYCGYEHCLKQLAVLDKLNEDERNDALVFSTRAMAALMAHKALMRVRYRDIQPAFWTEADALLVRALQYELAQVPVKLYPDLTYQTTIQREYVSGLLLDVAPTGNLLPTQTHCLYSILQHYNEHYRLSDRYSAQTPFFIDTHRGRPPQRWLVGLPPRSGIRFFGFGVAYKDLRGLRQAANADGRVPEWAQQSGIDSDRYRALLDILLRYWSHTPPQRRMRRDRHSGSILVAHEIRQVYRMLVYSKFAREGRLVDYRGAFYDMVLFADCRFGSVDESKPEVTPAVAPTPMEILEKFELAGDRALMERWSVVDASEGGLGVVAEKHRGWLRAGMLLCYRYEDSIDWRIAIVRRIGRGSQGKLGVGLECQRETVDYARLRVNKTNANEKWIAAGTSADPYADALLVGGAQPSLIVALGTYAPEHECVMKTEKSTRQIRFEKLLESGFDFEAISFSEFEKC